MPTSTGLRSIIDTEAVVPSIDADNYNKSFFENPNTKQRQFSSLSKGHPSTNLSDFG